MKQKGKGSAPVSLVRARADTDPSPYERARRQFNDLLRQIEGLPTHRPIRSNGKPLVVDEILAAELTKLLKRNPRCAKALIHMLKGSTIEWTAWQLRMTPTTVRQLAFIGAISIQDALRKHLK